jgi:hypothetical protein
VLSIGKAKLNQHFRFGGDESMYLKVNKVNLSDIDSSVKTC